MSRVGSEIETDGAASPGRTDAAEGGASMLRRSAAFIALCSAFFALPQLANAAPTPVAAWYMYGTTLSGLQSNAYSHGCSFAQHHPGGFRLLMLDFGAARKIDSNTWGALDFSGVRFSNPDILSALKQLLQPDYAQREDLDHDPDDLHLQTWR